MNSYILFSFFFLPHNVRFFFTLDCLQLNATANTFYLNALRRRQEMIWKIYRYEKFILRDNRNSRLTDASCHTCARCRYQVLRFTVSTRTSPLVGSAPGIFSKSRLQFTRRLIEFRTRTHAHSILPLWDAGCIIQPSHWFNSFIPLIIIY